MIVRLGDAQYVKWSNTVDAPVSHVMTRTEMIHELEAHDRVPFSQAIHLLELTDQSGVSDPDVDFAALLATNRAGPDETRLELDEILEHYRRLG